MSWQPPDEIHFKSRKLDSFIFPILLVGGMAALGAYVYSGWYYFAGAVGFCLLVSWLSLPGNITLRFFPEGFEVRPTGLRIAYADVTELRLSNRSVINHHTVNGSPYLVIGHLRGALRLPHHDAVDRVGLYDWLVAKTLLLNAPVSLPGRLEEVRTKDINDFGAEQVLATTARPIRPAEYTGSRMIFNIRNLWAFTVALLIGTIVAVVLEADKDFSFGLMFATVFLFLFALIGTAHRNGKRHALEKMREQSGLVISPRSLTLESKPIKGMMRWSEVKEMTVMPWQANGLSGIMLKIEGGQFIIGDHYEMPLTEIHRRIERYLAHER